MLIRYSWLLLLWWSVGELAAQRAKEWKQSAIRAEQAGDWVLAVGAWRGYLERERESDEARWSLGFAALRAGHYELADSAWSAMSAKGSKEPRVLYYKGRLAQARQQWGEAEEHWRAYLSAAKPEDSLRGDAKMRLRQLPQAFTSVEVAPLLAFATHLGAPLNSFGDDYGLMQTPVKDIWASTSRQRFPLDDGRPSYASPQMLRLSGGRWEHIGFFAERYAPQGRNTALMGFLDDGLQILFQRGDTVWIDNYDDEPQSLALPFALQAQAQWLGDFQFVRPDLLVFAAKTTEGYGQTDIYWAYWQAETQTWSEPFNLGLGINTMYDERSPFLAADGRTLYFSRYAPETMGGFDVFVSQFDENSLAWSAPQRLPAPINSAADDLFFSPQPDGLSAYVSSNRSPTIGGLDFFALAFLEPLASQQKQKNTFADVLLAPPMPQITEIPPIDSPKIAPALPIKYTLYPMFYENSLTGLPSVQRNAATLAELLKSEPNLQLLINAHASQITQNQGYTLFLALKQAENLAQQITAAGINPNRLRLRSFGSLSPVARQIMPDGQPSPQGARLNQRLELQILHTQNLPYQIKIQPITVSSILQPDTPNNYAQQQGLCFKILLHSSNLPWQHKILEQNLQLSLEQEPNTPLIHYLCGCYPTYNQAQAQLQQISTTHQLPNAKIQAHLDGWPLSIDQCQALAAQYPELKNFIDAQQK